MVPPTFRVGLKKSVYQTCYCFTLHRGQPSHFATLVSEDERPLAEQLYSIVISIHSVHIYRCRQCEKLDRYLALRLLPQITGFIVKKFVWRHDVYGPKLASFTHLLLPLAKTMRLSCPDGYWLDAGVVEWDLTCLVEHRLHRYEFIGKP